MTAQEAAPASVTVPRPCLTTAVAITCAAVTLWVARTQWTTWPALAVFAATGVVLAAIDLRHHLLPRRLVYPALGTVVVLVAFHALITEEWAPLGAAAGGAVGTAGFFYVIALSTQGLGLGDVRLGLLTGFVAGWSGLVTIGVALLLTTLIGAAAGVCVAVVTRHHNPAEGHSRGLPYGPAMIAGTLLSVWIQPPI